jgi:hypothetical protein
MKVEKNYIETDKLFSSKFLQEIMQLKPLK